MRTDTNFVLVRSFSACAVPEQIAPAVSLIPSLGVTDVLRLKKVISYSHSQYSTVSATDAFLQLRYSVARPYIYSVRIFTPEFYTANLCFYMYVHTLLH